MEKELLRELNTEICENLYTKAINNLNSNKDIQNIINKLITIEDEIRICNSEIKLSQYKEELQGLSKELDNYVKNDI